MTMPADTTVACAWCAHAMPGGTLSCPACGAPTSARPHADRMGWYGLPPIRNMARLQVGASSCQIGGTYAPVADFDLAAGDSVYFTHHVLLWQDPAVSLRTLPLRGGWKRLFAGLPLIMAAAHGPGHVAFSRDAPGEMVALPLDPGQAVDVREHAFLAATSAVAYDWFSTGIWFSTRGHDNETHYPLGMFMDRFSAGETPGLVLVHAAGNAFVRRLEYGESILIEPTALLFKDQSVGMGLHIEETAQPAGIGWWTGGQMRYLWLRLTGPGRVAVQSALSKHAGDRLNLSGSSSATRRRW